MSAHLSHCEGQSLRCSPGWGNSLHCIVALSVGEGSEREQCCLLSSQPAFSNFLHYPQANWALLTLIPRWVSLCRFQDPVGLSNELSCEAGSFSHYCNTHRFLQPEVLRLSFPMLEPWVAQSVLLPSFSSQFIHMQMWELPVLQPPSSPPCHPLHPGSLSLPLVPV